MFSLKQKSNYTLMHKNIPVCDLLVDEETGYLTKMYKIYNKKHMPPGTSDKLSLHKWWEGRRIPASREHLQEALDILQIPSSRVLILKSLGLSLSDHYWVKPHGQTVRWEEINFFDHDFSDDLGSLLFGDAKGCSDLFSPVNTSDGMLIKKWKIIDGKRVLIKGGALPFYQQPVNEVIASGLMEHLGIPHVSYSLLWEKDIPYSLCDDFVTKDSELVTMSHMIDTSKRGVDSYMECIKTLQDIGVSDAVHWFDQMLLLDFLLANEDRHFNNFGILRNPNTLEIIGMAPIYDTGSSLGYQRNTGQICNNFDYDCKPFFTKHSEQLSLVTAFDAIDIQKALEFAGEMESLLQEMSLYIDDARRESILASYRERCNYIKDLSKEAYEQEVEL